MLFPALPQLLCAAVSALLCAAALASSSCAAARACAACHHSGAHRARLRQLAALAGAGRAAALLVCALLLDGGLENRQNIPENAPITPRTPPTEAGYFDDPRWPRAVLQSAPALLALTFYTFVGVYFVHVARLVAGSGGAREDAAGAGGAGGGAGGAAAAPTQTRVYAFFANGLAYGGYGLLLAVALAFHRADASLWRWHACFLAAVSLGGGLAFLFLGGQLRRLLLGVPGMSRARRAAMVSRTSACTAIASAALVSRAVYGMLLASSLLGNDGPYPIRNLTVTNLTTQAELDQYAFECNAAESLAILVLELLPLVLMLCATNQKPSRRNRQGYRTDASLGVEELMSPLRAEEEYHARRGGDRAGNGKRVG
jgi:hypothetical protein